MCACGLGNARFNFSKYAINQDYLPQPPPHTNLTVNFKKKKNPDYTKISLKLVYKILPWDFPGGPVAKTLHS